MTDREYLQSLLDAAGEIVFPPRNPANGAGEYVLDAPLIVRSHSRITLDGCTLRLADGVYSNIFTTPGAWNGELSHGGDGSIPEKTTDVTICGKNGATLDGGQPNDLREATSNRDGRPHVLHNTLLLFRNIENFAVLDLNLIRLRYWGMTFYYAAHGEIRNIRFSAENNVPNQDGIDLRIGCHSIRIENLRGSTGDDTVALTALGGRTAGLFRIPGESPDIYDVTIQNVRTEVTGGHGIVRLLNHDGVRLHDITVRDIYDCLIDTRLTQCQAAVRIGDVRYWSVRPALPEETHDILVDGVTTNARVPVLCAQDYPNCTLLHIRHVD